MDCLTKERLKCECLVFPVAAENLKIENIAIVEGLY